MGAAVMLPTHVFDSSAWIGAWNELYAREVFPAVWTRLERAVASGVVASPAQVIEEIFDQDDELKQWMRPRGKALTDALNARKRGKEAEELAVRLRNEYPALKTRTGADYYVIAWAKTLRIPLVATESPKATSLKAMAGVCRAEQVVFRSPLQFMQAEKWTFP